MFRNPSRNAKAAVLAALWVFGLVTNAHAAVIQGTLQATIVDSFDDLGTFGLVGDDVYNGAVVTILFWFDTSSAPVDTESSPDVGLFDSASPDWLRTSATINGITFSEFLITGAADIDQQIVVANDVGLPARDSLAVAEDSMSVTSPVPDGTLFWNGISIVIEDFSATMLGDDSLPTELNVPGASVSGLIFIAEFDYDSSGNETASRQTFVSISGDVSASLLVTPVPEPTTLGLLAFGFGAAIGARRRRSLVRAPTA